MTGSTEFLTNHHKENGGQVTFGDGAKGSVVGKGDLNVQGLPKLKNLLLVDGLKANLISISQLCDQNLYVNFTKDGCKVMDEEHISIMDDEHISVLEGTRTGDNCYKLILLHQCQYTKENTTQLWHKRLGHIHSRGLQKLIKYEAVRGLPTLTETVETVCKGCMEGKQHRTPHPALKIITTKQPLELLNIDLMGSLQTESVAGKKYVLVCVDDCTSFTGIECLRKNSKAFKLFVNLCKWLMTEKFDYRSMEGIFVEYSRNNHAYRVFMRSANIVIETVNVEIADQNEDFQMLDDVHVPFIQKEGTVSTVTGTSEATSVDKPEVTLVELSIGESSKDMQVSYTKTQESASGKENALSIRVQKNHPTDAIIGNVNKGMNIRGKKKNYGDMVKFVCYISQVEPKKVEETLKDEFWIRVMQEELEQFERNQVWTLVPRSTNLNVIGTKWVFKNKMVEGGKVILEYLSIENQLADIFRKSLDAKRLQFLHGALGLCCI
ncbi:hypothetical protein H6P81_016212 [Aristolochia fimbriata]|uniref:Uncharacterized protein n=1 Tax=Aristolochia fimbriata TaxID=158543 RepID=A0AAV7EAW2_ARIFI|nr:hypothetical protein H6P81_016212 [Aristolochia fimbriata]